MANVGNLPKEKSLRELLRRVRWPTQRITLALRWLRRVVLAVPVRIKISGLVLLPVLILGLAVNFWVRGSLSDWLSWLLEADRVGAAMESGGRSIIMVTALATALSLVVSWLLMLILTEPLLELKRVADKVRAGELDQRADVRYADEIGEVGRSFNAMLDWLVRSQRALESSNQHLAALVHVATSVAGGLDLPGVLESALNSTLEATGLESGWIYLRDAETERFFLACSVEPPAVITAQPQSNGYDLCGCQQALMNDPDWNKPAQRACRRLAPLGEGFGELLPVHLSIPLRARGMKLGILNLLWTKESAPDEFELDLLDAIGSQVSEAVANARLHSDLQAKEAGMEALLNSLVTAQEDERSLISSELHDGAGQELTSVLLRLKALSEKKDPVALRAGVGELCTVLSGAIENIRQLSHQLRPPDLEQLGLAPTLRNLVVDTVGEAGLEVGLRCNLEHERLDPLLEITLYRIAQEALTNIVRHADAERAALSLIAEEEGVSLIVEDDGAGFDPDDLAHSSRAHIGLASIQERAERLQGKFEVATGPGMGTRLSVWIPTAEVEQ